MNRKETKQISPDEALAIFEYSSVEEFERVGELYRAYRANRGTATDRLWDEMCLLTFVYVAARVQGIREERKRRL